LYTSISTGKLDYIPIDYIPIGISI
jgi:hypothetical protein